MQQMNVHFHNVERSEALEAYLRRKISRALSQFLDRPEGIEVAFEEKSKGFFEVVVSLKGNGFNGQIADSGRYLYDSVDRVTNKFLALMRKRKSDLRDVAEERPEESLPKTVGFNYTE